MKRKRLVWINVIAAFCLLLFVFSSWLKPLDLFEVPHQFSRSEQFACVVPTSSTVYLAETKPRITGFSGCLSAPLLVDALSPFQYQNVSLDDWTALEISGSARPLWLLNRSLLI